MLKWWSSILGQYYQLLVNRPIRKCGLTEHQKWNHQLSHTYTGEMGMFPVQVEYKDQHECLPLLVVRTGCLFSSRSAVRKTTLDLLHPDNGVKVQESQYICTYVLAATYCNFKCTFNKN